MSETEIVHFIGGYAVQMAMVDLKTGNDETDTRTPERRALREPNTASDVKEMCARTCRQINPLIHRLAGNDECMAVRNRLNGHEDDAEIILQCKMTG